MRIRIQSAALAFALPHVSSKESSNPAIKGLLIEPSGVVVATNGTSMLAYKNAAEGCDTPVIVRFHKPNEVAGKKVAYVEIDLPNEPAREMVTVRTFVHYGAQLGVTLADVIEGKFPDWRRVWPTPHEEPVPVAKVGLGPAVASLFSKSSDRPYTLTYYGAHKAAVVNWAHNSDAAGLWMPADIKGAWSPPTWIHPSADWPPVPHPDTTTP